MTAQTPGPRPTRGARRASAARDPDDRCAARSSLVGEPMAGSAPVAATWLLIEQPGPWGAQALTESRLPHPVATRLAQAARATGVRVGLIRAPGRHPDGRPADAGRLVLLAHTTPGRTELRAWRVDDPALLPTLLATRGSGGDGPPDGPLGAGHPVTTPLLVVCTNGHRDPCCARGGLPLAAALAHAHPGRVWEGTHMGGHRFAPTALVLPWGALYGRLDLPAATALLEAADQGRLPVDGYRGRAALTRPAQVAEAAVRGRLGITGPDDLSAQATAVAADTWRVTVRHADGRGWACEVRPAPEPVGPRPTSCGGPAELVRPLVAGPLRALTDPGSGPAVP